VHTLETAGRPIFWLAEIFKSPKLRVNHCGDQLARVRMHLLFVT
jgi:hypothetical protein